MRHFIATILLLQLLCPLAAHAQKSRAAATAAGDLIVRRDGSEAVAKVSLVTPAYTYFQKQGAASADEQVWANADIYMIKFADRGNMFFSEAGDIFFGSDAETADKNAATLYLTKGEEITAYDVSTDERDFRYYLTKTKGDFRTTPKREVFAVKYPNRPTEVVTPFTAAGKAASLQELPLPEDEFVELQEAKPALEYVIKTKKNAIIRALVVYGNDTFVSYYRKEAPSGPLYRMERENIKSITKAASKKARR